MVDFSVQVLGRQWLSAHAFEIRFTRPPGLTFIPGQKIRFLQEDTERDYSLINSPEDPQLALCVRHIPAGLFFYLCGRSEMIRDAIRIIERRFSGSHVYTEIFF